MGDAGDRNQSRPFTFMQGVTVYTKPLCPYCVRAMSLLRKKGAKVTEISAAFDAEKRQEMLRRSNGQRTYPQIFIGDYHVGGCDDLYALEAGGKLDALLDA
jgi:glutaredoxin 3